jgi:hypothetical protein
MLQVVSGFRGCTLEVLDGTLGTVSDFLFDDRTWKTRWLVIDTGSWLPGRKVLLHPTAVKSSDLDQRLVRVDLTRAQVEASPNIGVDQPVSRQNESDMYLYYGWDPRWDTGLSGGGFGLPRYSPSSSDDAMLRTPFDSATSSRDDDPHLRSITAITSYHVHAFDGSIGHIENFLIDDADWGIRYLIVDTRNWLAGQEVLLSPYAITTISWADHRVMIDLTREQVKKSPPWNPVEVIDQTYEERLHSHYGWPGYGW